MQACQPARNVGIVMALSVGRFSETVVTRSTSRHLSPLRIRTQAVGKAAIGARIELTLRPAGCVSVPADKLKVGQLSQCPRECDPGPPLRDRAVHELKTVQPRRAKGSVCPACAVEGWSSAPC